MKLTESTLRNIIRQEITNVLNEAHTSSKLDTIMEPIVDKLNAYVDNMEAKVKQGATKPDAQDISEMEEILKMMTTGLSLDNIFNTDDEDEED